MTVKEELHQLVDTLPAEGLEEALDYLRWLASEADILSEQELAGVEEGEAQIARGEYTTLAELRRNHDG